MCVAALRHTSDARASTCDAHHRWFPCRASDSWVTRNSVTAVLLRSQSSSPVQKARRLSWLLWRHHPQPCECFALSFPLLEMVWCGCHRRQCITPPLSRIRQAPTSPWSLFSALQLHNREPCGPIHESHDAKHVTTNRARRSSEFALCALPALSPATYLTQSASVMFVPTC